MYTVEYVMVMCVYRKKKKKKLQLLLGSKCNDYNYNYLATFARLLLNQLFKIFR